MSKITNDGLTRCFIAVPNHVATVGIKGLTNISITLLTTAHHKLCDILYKHLRNTLNYLLINILHHPLAVSHVLVTNQEKSVLCGEDQHSITVTLQHLTITFWTRNSRNWATVNEYYCYDSRFLLNQVDKVCYRQRRQKIFPTERVDNNG